MSINKLIGFNDLISGTLVDFIEAEHQAAKASLEMIESLGFEQDSEGRTVLKMAKFVTEQYDADGNVQQIEHQIPQLSLLPIPLMKTSVAELEFGVKINDFEEMVLGEASSLLNSDQNQVKTKCMRMKTTIGRMDLPNGQSNSTSQLDMRVKLKLEPADFPTGITNLLHIMEQSTANTDISPDETLNEADNG